MPCVEIPIPNIPTLPDPLRLALSIPDLPDLTFDLCCKLPPFPVDIPVIPLPALVFNVAVMGILNAYIAQMNTYLNAIPLNCPLE